MRKNRTISEGTLIAISPSAGREVVAKVIYSSRYFKDVILMAVYEKDASLPLAELLPKVLVYTAGKCVGHGSWVEIGFEPVVPLEQARSKRIVGGEVWCGDSLIGPAADTDWKELEQMAVSGCVSAERKILAAFGWL